MTQAGGVVLTEAELRGLGPWASARAEFSGELFESGARMAGWLESAEERCAALARGVYAGCATAPRERGFEIFAPERAFLAEAQALEVAFGIKAGLLASLRSGLSLDSSHVGLIWAKKGLRLVEAGGAEARLAEDLRTGRARFWGAGFAEGLESWAIEKAASGAVAPGVFLTL